MILSVSRRTDIPNYYSEWFLNRVKEGYLYVRNPMNPHQISEIDIRPEVVDCIVFWTKNPEPMLARLDELKEYPYYFQFTLTGYGKDMEPGVPHKREVMIPVFQELSRRIGSGRVIWRYDPILFTEKYTMEYHKRAFAEIARCLKGYTCKVVVSFVDWYAKMGRNMKGIQLISPQEEQLRAFAGGLCDIAGANGMKMGACAEDMDLRECGIEPNCCIDRELAERLAGYPITAGKDRNQRSSCGCVESVEVGAYDTCRNGCRYCYANSSGERVRAAAGKCRADSPLLCGEAGPGDKITRRLVKSLRDRTFS